MNKTTTEQPQGRSLRELRKIVEASNARYFAIGELWSDLSDEQQETLVETATVMAGSNS